MKILVCTDGSEYAVGAIKFAARFAKNYKADLTTLETAATNIQAKTDEQPAGVKKSVAFSNFTFLMVNEIDHLTPIAGVTVSGTISKDGAAFAACANVVTEISGGLYKVDLTALEMDADIASLIFTATGADQTTLVIKTSS